VSIEAAVAQPWWRWLGTHGKPVSLEHYGASADAKTLFTEFGITAGATVIAAEESLVAARAATGPSTRPGHSKLRAWRP
jgi:transketolase